MFSSVKRSVLPGLNWLSYPSKWTLVTLLIALPVAVPILAVLAQLFTPYSDAWTHLRETLLFEYILNTLELLVWVGCISFTLGVGCAWLTATKVFPGRTFFAWSLILPLAAPAYVVAYAYGDLLAVGGPLQGWWQEISPYSTLPSLRSLPGAGIVLGFTLYPYVYLLSFNAFAEQSISLTEASRTLGASNRRTFFKVALPHARPAIAGGVLLALMETAADFGVVEFFGVPTLTNGIFRTWYAMGEPQAAMQLAAYLFVIVACLISFERIGRRGRHFNPVARNVATPKTPLRRGRGWLATATCAIPLLIGFILPIGMLGYHALNVGDPTFGATFTQYLQNSIAVGLLGACIAAVLAILLTYAARMRRDLRPLKFFTSIATLGYAIPGMVLAVGMLGPLTTADKWFARTMNTWFDADIGLVLTGSVAVLVFVYVARFLTVAFNSVDSGMDRIHPNYDDSAKSLGASSVNLLRRIHLPLLTPALLTAALLVFVDIVKELPATLILRPFNFETLATRAYRLASDERIAEASTAAILIVVVGLLPTLLLAIQNVVKPRHQRLSDSSSIS